MLFDGFSLSIYLLGVDIYRLQYDQKDYIDYIMFSKQKNKPPKNSSVRLRSLNVREF